MGQQFGPMQQRIYERLKSSFAPVFLTVENESHTHNVPRGSESHFRVVIVTDAFVSQRLIKRHKAVNEVLTNEIAVIHALALHTYTPEEWRARREDVPSSPHCLGGELKVLK